MSACSDTLDSLFVRNCRAHQIYTGRMFEKLGLYRGQPPVLFELDQQDGRTHTELAGQMGVTAATMTTMVKRMEQSGFVTRRRDPLDGRISRVFLTDAGRAVLAEARALTLEMENITFAGFSETEKWILRGYLQRMLVNLTVD